MLFDAVALKVDMLESPAVLLVAVTLLPLALALTPAAVGQALMAAARFVAKVAVLVLVMKVPVNGEATPVHVVDPLLPAAFVLFQAKPPAKLSASVMAPAVPRAAAVTVTAPPLEVAPAPMVPLLVLIALARFVAAVVTSVGLEMAKFVPEVVPLLPVPIPVNTALVVPLLVRALLYAVPAHFAAKLVVAELTVAETLALIPALVKQLLPGKPPPVLPHCKALPLIAASRFAAVWAAVPIRT